MENIVEDRRLNRPHARVSVSLSQPNYKKFLNRCTKRGMTVQGVLKELVEAWSQEKITIKKEI